MSGYTPTTERVRDTWTNAMSEGCASDEELADAEWDTERRDAQFDRWLDARDAEKDEWIATLESLIADVYTILKPLAENESHGSNSHILRMYGLLNAQDFTKKERAS